MSVGNLIPIKEFCTTGSGTTPSRKTPDYYRDGRYAWVKSGELRENIIFTTEERVSQKALDETSLKLVDEGAILIAMYGATVGRMARLGIKATTNQAICHVIPDTSVADTNYLYQYLQYKVPTFLALAMGGAQPNINQKTIKEHVVPLPPLEYQRFAADILDRADALRTARRKSIEKLDQLLQSVFLDMFGDPIVNPKGWEVKPLGKLTDVGTGSTPSRKNIANYEGEIPWVKTTEVDNNVIDSTEEKISPEALRASRLKMYPANSIAIAMYGQGKTRGKSAILGIPTTVNQACAILLPQKTYNTYFLFTLLQLCYENLRSLGRGGNQPNLNLSLVKSFCVILPPIEKQCYFSAIYQKIVYQKLKKRKSLRGLENLFNSLQQRAFRGELTSSSLAELDTLASQDI